MGLVAALVALGAGLGACADADDGDAKGPENVIETGYLVCGPAVDACEGGPGCQPLGGDLVCLDVDAACSPLSCDCVSTDVCKPGTCFDVEPGEFACAGADGFGQPANPDACESDAECDDANPCTEDACDGICYNHLLADGSVCDDGQACTTADVCSAGICTGMPVNCDDGNDCTADECDSSGACQHVVVPGCGAGPCAADSDCEGSGECGAAACVNGECVAAATADGAECDDGDPCTVNDVCAAGACAGSAMDCDDGDACTADECDPSGECTHTAVPGCLPPSCQADLDCNDGNPCTIGACIDGECHFPAAVDGAACDDGDLCTAADQCLAGVCFGDPLSCDDGDECTEDECNAATGGCDHIAVPGAGCLPPACAAGLDCDDSNPCTVDSCVDGACMNALAADGTACDDGNLCTVVDICAAGLCVGAPVDCDDSYDCSLDLCDPEVGCVHMPDNEACPGACLTSEECDDGNPCTWDACDGICYNHPELTGPACNDGDPCTEQDTCDAGQCVGALAAPTCESAICQISGVAGQVVECALQLARASEMTEAPSAMSLVFSYDKFGFSITDIWKGAGLAAGVGPSISPVSPDEWAGSGAMVFVNVPIPDYPLSTAYLENGSILPSVSSAEMVVFQVVLSKDISPANPAEIHAYDISVGSTSGTPMTVDFIDNVLVVQ